MKSKDDKSEDGSDQERECPENDRLAAPRPLARSVHVLTRIYCVFTCFLSPYVLRLYTYIYIVYVYIYIPCELTAEIYEVNFLAP